MLSKSHKSTEVNRRSFKIGPSRSNWGLGGSDGPPIAVYRPFPFWFVKPLLFK